MTPIDFCPAAAAAEELARLEAYLDLVLHGLNQAITATPAVPGALLRQIELHAEASIEAMEAARTRLSGATARSAAGAMAQLLAAIRDTRVGDNPARAALLEAQAIRFLALNRQPWAGIAQAISRTPPAAIEPSAQIIMG
jgi:hypothetical protein